MAGIGEQILTARKAKGLTQDALAETLNVSRSTVANWENGRRIPDGETLLRLSKALEYSFEAETAFPHEAEPDKSEAAEDAAAEAGEGVSELKSRVNGYTAEQSSAGSRPRLVETDGRYALSFDGNDMLVVRDFESLEGHTGFTLAAVSRAAEKGAGGDEWSNRQSLIMIYETGGYGAIFVGSYQ